MPSILIIASAMIFIIVFIVIASSDYTNYYSIESIEKERYRKEKKYYSRVNRTLKKYRKFLNGKGKKLSKEDIDFLKKYVKRYIRENPNEKISELSNAILNEDCLDYSDDLLSSILADPTENKEAIYSIDSNIADNDWNEKFKDMDYSINNMSNEKRRRNG